MAEPQEDLLAEAEKLLSQQEQQQPPRQAAPARQPPEDLLGEAERLLGEPEQPQAPKEPSPEMRAFLARRGVVDPVAPEQPKEPDLHDPEFRERMRQLRIEGNRAIRARGIDVPFSEAELEEEFGDIRFPDVMPIEQFSPREPLSDRELAEYITGGGLKTLGKYVREGGSKFEKDERAERALRRWHFRHGLIEQQIKDPKEKDWQEQIARERFRIESGGVLPEEVGKADIPFVTKVVQHAIPFGLVPSDDIRVQAPPGVEQGTLRKVADVAGATLGEVTAFLATRKALGLVGKSVKIPKYGKFIAEFAKRAPLRAQYINGFLHNTLLFNVKDQIFRSTEDSLRDRIASIPGTTATAGAFAAAGLLGRLRFGRFTQPAALFAIGAGSPNTDLSAEDRIIGGLTLVMLHELSATGKMARAKAKAARVLRQNGKSGAEANRIANMMVDSGVVNREAARNYAKAEKEFRQSKAHINEREIKTLLDNLTKAGQLDENTAQAFLRGQQAKEARGEAVRAAEQRRGKVIATEARKKMAPIRKRALAERERLRKARATEAGRRDAIEAKRAAAEQPAVENPPPSAVETRLAPELAELRGRATRAPADLLPAARPVPPLPGAVPAAPAVPAALPPGRPTLLPEGVTVPEEAVQPFELPSIEPELAPLPTNITGLRSEAARLGLKTTGSKKMLINRITGVTRPPSPEVVTTERAMLNARLRAEARGAKHGKAVGRVERAAEIRQQIKTKAATFKENRAAVREYARETLPEPDFKTIELLATRATTPARLNSIMKRVDKLAQRQDASQARKDLVEQLRRAKKEKLRPEFQKIVDSVMEDIDPTKLSPKKRLRLESLQSFLERSDQHNVPQELVDEVTRLSKVPISKMTPQDVRNLADAVRSARSQNTLKKRLEAAQKNRTVEQHADEFARRAAEIAKPLKEARPGVPEEKGGLINRARLTSQGLETNAEEIDGWQIGAASDILFRKTVKPAQNKRAVLNSELRSFVRTKLREAGIDIREIDSWSQPMLDSVSTRFVVGHVGGRRFARLVGPSAKSITENLDSGQKVTLTFGETATLWRLAKSEAGLKNLLHEDGGIRIRNHPVVVYKLTPNDLQNLFQALPQEVKTVADIAHEYENTVAKQNINETSRKTIGTDLAKETDRMRFLRDRQDVKELGVTKGSRPGATVQQRAVDDRSWLKPRTGVIAPLVVDDAFTAFWNEARDVNHYVAYAEPMQIIRSFLSRNKVRQAIIRTHGKNMLREIESAIDDIENPGRPPNNVFLEVAEKGRRKVVTGALGLGGVLGGVSVIQTISYWAAEKEIEFKYLLRALSHEAPSAEEVAQSNPILAERLGRTRFERDAGSSDSAREFWTGKTTLDDKAMRPVSWGDSRSILYLWRAAQLKHQELHPATRGDVLSKAIGDMTEEIVRKTQPTFAVEDRSGVSRSQNLALRLATSFTSQLNKAFQILTRATNEYRASDRTPRDKAKLFRTSLFQLLILPAMVQGVREIRKLILNRAARKEMDAKAHGVDLAIGTLQNALSMVYVAGPVLSKMIDKIRGKGYFGDPSGIDNILTTAIGEVVKGTAGISRDALQGKLDVRTLRDVKRLTTALTALLTGLPAGPAARNIETLLKGTGLVDPESPYFTGRRKQTKTRGAQRMKRPGTSARMTRPGG